MSYTENKVFKNVNAPVDSRIVENKNFINHSVIDNL